MYQSFYQGNPFLDLPVLAMFLFAVTFSAVVIRAWIRGSGNTLHDSLSQLPLEDGEGRDHISNAVLGD